MASFEEIRVEIVDYFLTEFPNDHAIAFVETIVKEILCPTYHEELVEDFWEKTGHRVIEDLIKERDRRIIEKLPIYFSFEDSGGTIVKGWSNINAELDTAEFQKALLRLSHSEFETLSARILQLIGCVEYWVTPSSHDQGIDAFGKFPLLPAIVPEFQSSRGSFHCWILVQAKHYGISRIDSATIRDFAGAAHFARFGTYAQESAKYGELDLKVDTPIGLVITTSGEVKRTARLLVQRADIFILTTSDICAIFTRHWRSSQAGLPTSSDNIVLRLQLETLNVPIAT